METLGMGKGYCKGSLADFMTHRTRATEVAVKPALSKRYLPTVEARKLEHH